MANRTKTAGVGAAGAKLRADDSLSADDIRALAGDLGDFFDLLEDPSIWGRPARAGQALRLPQPASPFLQRRHGRQFGATIDAPFNAEWLSLRERFDARARSRALAHRLAAMLAERVTLVEPGAGTFSLFRWLAPIIARPQHWICLDNDEEHLLRGLRLTAAWGRRLGYAVEPREDWTQLALHTPHGVWSIQPVCYDLEEALPPFLPFDKVHGVVCSALLDLFSEDWLRDLLCSLHGVPFYAAMTVTGGVWRNRHDRDDALVLEGFRRNQIGNEMPRPTDWDRTPHSWRRIWPDCMP